jgi:uncharacterized protein (TIGR03435 family)
MTTLSVSKPDCPIRALAIVAGLTILVTQTLGQRNVLSPQYAAVKAPAYEVVSVRMSKLYSGMSLGSPPGRYSARNVTLWMLLVNAYSLTPSASVPGLPGWATSVQFDVEAKMDDDTALALQKMPIEKQDEQRRLMLQSLLADRFKLHVHNEIKTRPIYALVAAKGGSKLKEVPAIEGGHRLAWGPGRIDIRAGSIENLVFCLSDTLGRVVVDKTGLTGKYDISLKWTLDEQQGTGDGGPSILTALQEQLGLKLESTKGPSNTLVVDHVEKPSEN